VAEPTWEWRSAVTVREDPELARVLVDRLPSPDAAKAVSVTDLVAPRRAYWRAVASVPLPPERQARVERGRALHRRLGVALSTEGQLEVRVRRDGVVGRIDLLGDVPVEVKTGGSDVATDELVESRPEHLEQLAMYCALSDRPRGRLLTVVASDERVIAVRAADLGVREVALVRREMVAGADALRRARALGSPDELPRCRWFGRGCEFRDAGVCDCSAGSGTEPSPILSALSPLEDRADVADRVLGRIRETVVEPTPSGVERFRDLLYPRRTYFARTSVVPSASPVPLDPAAPVDLYGRVVHAVEGGPVGETARLVPRAGGIAEEVGAFRGEPYLVRTSRARERPTGSDLVRRQPQYPMELGLRCVATGRDTARLILGWEGATSDAERVRVFEFRFAPLTAFARLWRERLRDLEAAVLGRAPAGLAPCPGWMYPDCPYRVDCACGAVGRSQR
jgi:hypothetical protein